jgi:preprotein translocase subunit SecF
MRIFANANFPFLNWRKRAYVVSAVLLLAGIGAMVVNTVRTGTWLNYGIDFAGGTLVQVQFAQPTSVEQLRAAGEPGWQITRFGEANEFVIRMPTFQGDADADAEVLVHRTFDAEFGAENVNVVRVEAVGPRVGAELQQRALLAILVSMLLTLVYVAFRFEWRFGVAAVIATAHDIVLTLGFLALFNYEISVGTVAAFLTILGYSLNDTIVVFDRIRENLLRVSRGSKFLDVINRSINDTLPRTVLTSGTTLATLMSLYLFGGAVIRDFALVLIVGITIGTYSSIFVASPALLQIERRWPRDSKKKSTPAAGRTRATSAV